METCHIAICTQKGENLVTHLSIMAREWVTQRSAGGVASKGQASPGQTTILLNCWQTHSEDSQIQVLSSATLPLAASLLPTLWWAIQGALTTTCEKARTQRERELEKPKIIFTLDIYASSIQQVIFFS